MTNDQEELIVSLLQLKQGFEEAARDITSFLNSKQIETLSNSKCKELLKNVKTLYRGQNPLKK